MERGAGQPRGPSLTERALAARPGRRGVIVAACAAAVLAVAGAVAWWPVAPPASLAKPARARAVPADMGTVLARLSAALPAEAALHLAGRDAGGVLRVEVDSVDPETLRQALARDPLLRRLRTEDESRLPDRGYRVRLTGPREDGDAGPADATRLQEAARAERLLVETLSPKGEVALSGDEAAVMRFIGSAGAQRVRLARWRLETEGGAVRLAALATVAPGTVNPPRIGRRLFAADTGMPSGGPELAGIVGRLPDDAVALVRQPGGRARSVRPGGTVDGWTLAGLSADAALFTRAGERLRVPLPDVADDVRP